MSLIATVLANTSSFMGGCAGTFPAVLGIGPLGARDCARAGLLTANVAAAARQNASFRMAFSRVASRPSGQCRALARSSDLLRRFFPRFLETCHKARQRFRGDT